MGVENLKFLALPVPEIGGTWKFWAVPGYVHSPFSTKFFMGFCSKGSYMNVRLSFWAGVAKPQSCGSGGRRGSGMAPFERALVTSYMPSIVTFPLCLRVSETGLMCRFCARARHFFLTYP